MSLLQLALPFLLLLLLRTSSLPPPLTCSSTTGPAASIGDFGTSLTAAGQVTGQASPDRVKVELKTRMHQVLLDPIVHNIFGVDLAAVEDHILVVGLLPAIRYASFRENRVKRSTGSGCILRGSSFMRMLAGSTVG